jgi:rod shape-determining protein MreC
MITNQQSKRNFRFYLVLLGLSGVLWWADGRGWLDWLKRPAAVVAQPIQRRLYRLSRGKQVEPKPALTKETTEKTVLEAEIWRLKEENEQLRQLLGAPLPPDWQFIPANILQLGEDFLLVDMGEDGGVAKGDQVLVLTATEGVKNGVLLGRIEVVGPRQARVRLLNQAESRVKVQSSQGALGVVKGEDGQLRLTEVLQQDSLERGDLLLTKGGDGWKPGLAVGRVGAVEKVETAVYQQAEVEPVVAIEELTQVFVVK